MASEKTTHKCVCMCIGAFVSSEIPAVGLADSLSTGDHFDELSKLRESAALGEGDG